MTVKSISTSKNISITTENNSLYQIEIRTFLGTTIFKDSVFPKDKIIKIKGLKSGKYIIHISNEVKFIKQQIWV